MSKSFSVSIPAPLELKVGQKITVVLYQGPNKVKVKTLLDYLKGFKDENKPIPLKNSGFDVKIENVLTDNFRNYDKNVMVYKVIMRGELLECQNKSQ